MARPDIVVAIGLKAAQLAHDRLPSTPLIYALVPAPERHGLAGPMVTGISADIPPGLELEVLRSLAPDVRRVGVVVGPSSKEWTREAKVAAKRLRMHLEVSTAGDLGELGPKVRELASRADALWLAPDPSFSTPEVFRLELAQSLAHRVPLLAFAPPLVDAGALAAAAPDLGWLGERLAEMTRRVQSGERPGDVPTSPIRHVRPFVNLATARAIGREVPGAALSGAEVVP
jgi:putative ABC transport system substrate-binding protein